MSHSPMLNEWVMRSQMQTINRTAEQMRLIRQSGGTETHAKASAIETLRARVQKAGNSATIASSRAAKGALPDIKAWFGLDWMQSEEQAEA